MQVCGWGGFYRPRGPEQRELDCEIPQSQTDLLFQPPLLLNMEFSEQGENKCDKHYSREPFLDTGLNKSRA